LASDWSENSISLLRRGLRQNTLTKYDAWLVNCAAFCEKRGEIFPPTKSSLIADWLVNITLHTDRPEPTIKTACAALSSINIRGDIPIDDPLLARLKKGIIDARTSRPMKQGVLFDIQILLDFLKNKFEPTEIKEIRDKAMVLLALVTMARPSDITHLQLQHFSLVNGILRIDLFGIKNDYNKRSIRKTISPCNDLSICPIRALTTWIGTAKQQNLLQDQNSFVFMKLNKKRGPLCSQTVSNIFKKFIIMAGGPKECTGKSIRTSSATHAAKMGLSPLQIMSMGGWKDLFVMAHHYIQQLNFKDSTNILFNISPLPNSNVNQTSHLQQLASSVSSLIEIQDPLQVVLLDEELDE
jgi:site-specific recombinase XerD